MAGIFTLHFYIFEPFAAHVRAADSSKIELVISTRVPFIEKVSLAGRRGRKVRLGREREEGGKVI